MNWNLSNENLLELIDKLRNAASGELDYGELWERCEQAAEILQEMIQYEAEHGLRSAIELAHLALDEMVATNQTLGLYDESVDH